jgi:hypothetical protein
MRYQVAVEKNPNEGWRDLETLKIPTKNFKSPKVVPLKLVVLLLKNFL